MIYLLFFSEKNYLIFASDFCGCFQNLVERISGQLFLALIGKIDAEVVIQINQNSDLCSIGQKIVFITQIWYYMQDYEGISLCLDYMPIIYISLKSIFI